MNIINTSWGWAVPSSDKLKLPAAHFFSYLLSYWIAYLFNRVFVCLLPWLHHWLVTSLIIFPTKKSKKKEICSDCSEICKKKTKNLLSCLASCFLLLATCFLLLVTCYLLQFSWCWAWQKACQDSSLKTKTCVW